MVMTAEVIPLESVNALITQTKAAWDRADEKKADADDWYVRTGKLLIQVKRRAGHGGWSDACKGIGRSKRRAEELIEFAKGTKTAEDERSRARTRMAKKRANKANARNVPRISPNPEEPEGYADQSPEERWQNSLANLCGDIIAIVPYWNKQFPGWEQFNCPSHIKTLVKEAATALASITKTATKR